jgi:hypothetical protein
MKRPRSKLRRRWLALRWELHGMRWPPAVWVFGTVLIVLWLMSIRPPPIAS